jgi:membrane associated rhomboid family serine protease
MIDVPVVHRSLAHWLDVCTRCQIVWFDPKEFEACPAMPVAAPEEPVLDPAAREALAVEQVKRMAEQARRGEGRLQPVDSWWEVFPALLGLPVEVEVEPVRRAPVVTWSLAGAVVVLSLFALVNLEGAVHAFGFIPAEAWRYGGLTALTSFFLHGGIFHLLGNVYFLLVFGDNVEDFLGRRRFLLLLIASTVAGDVAHAWGDPHSMMPCVGASGGVSGVIAFYALRFPKARLGLYWRFLILIRRITLPVWGAFVLWLLLQILIAGLQVGGGSPVSGLAHLGGAAAGAAMWAACRTRA